MRNTRTIRWTGVCLSSVALLTSAIPAWADHDAAAAPGHATHGPATAGSPDPTGVQAPKAVDQTLSLIREASLALLKEGNGRYAAGKPKHPNQDASRRSITVSEGQKPFATILACSDSRSPVEVLFDRGIGELFVVRVAGNVADETQVATIEYGVEHLGTPLLVVLGHTGCGAVSAACKGGELHGHLPALINRIQPAVTKARAVTTTPDRLIPTAIQANVWQQIEEVYFQSSLLREKVREGALQIVGGIYDLDKGTVNWLGAHPNQDSLLAQADAAEKEAALSASVNSHGDATAHGAAASASDAHGHGDAHPAPTTAGHEPSEAHDHDSLPKGLLPIHEVHARTPQAGHGSDSHDEHGEHAAPAPHH